MAFGQQSGPPATARQVQQLTTLLSEAGHSDFRDARGPLGLTQRQAAGKFTRDEATELIERLEAEAEAGDAADPADGLRSIGTSTGAAGAGDRGARRASPPTRAVGSRVAGAGAGAGGGVSIRTVPSAVLAAELQRRGWIVVEG
jgi:hypothetical protein